VIVDADSHLSESRDLWRQYVDPAQRHLALTIEDDELGYAWLTQAGRRIALVEMHHPGDVAAMGRYRARQRRGEPSDVRYDDWLPREYWDPAARRDLLDGFGVDATVLFPNFGLLWEEPLSGDLAAVLANMGAWNRWSVEVAAEGQGRLYPVGHVSLRDLDWLGRELAALSAGGVRLAMMAPSLVDERPLSHPDLDRAWAAFVEHGVTPVFHVSAFPKPFHEAWYDTPEDIGVISSVFLWTAPAMALADMAVNGVFERHPDLRLGVMELAAIWVPQWLLMLDGGFDFHARFNGEPLRTLALRPSEYVQRQVKVAAFGYERPGQLIRHAGDMFMFCSDWPHAEGFPRPLDDYRAASGPVEGAAGDSLYGGNVRWLLRDEVAAST
jgi:predicted TIM-barrel fold metal-dependent hydrolase